MSVRKKPDQTSQLDVQPQPQSLPAPDFDAKLDNLIVSVEGYRAMIDDMVIEIWKICPDVIKLTVLDPSPDEGFTRAMGLPVNPRYKEVLNEVQARKSLAALDWDAAIKFLKYIRQIRSMRPQV